MEGQHPWLYHLWDWGVATYLYDVLRRWEQEITLPIQLIGKNTLLGRIYETKYYWEATLLWALEGRLYPH